MNVSDRQTGREGKYLTFSLAGEEYGIGILKVKEIIGLMTDYAGAENAGAH